MNKTLLFNPISIVHDRNVSLFKKFLPEWNVRFIYNSKNPWVSDRKKYNDDICYFTNGYPPKNAFKDVKSVILFSAQPRIFPCNLIEEATLRSIPVIAIQEVYQMMLEQGFVNEYFLPVDHFFVASEYEREKLLEFGIPSQVVETTGCMFSYKGATSTDSGQKEILRDRLGLSKDKRIATLSLAYQTPSGETLGIRRQLIETVSQGLPKEYELLVKPHPAEQDLKVESFIKKSAPKAKVVDKFTPVNEVLDITDVLFNRGTSQVIIDALRKKVPVVIIPTGRKTFFDGFLDEVIVNKKEDIVKVFELIRRKGFSIYNPIFEKYVTITPDEAFEKIMFRITQIANGEELYKPEERLMEMGLFWAWMGYIPKSQRILAKVRSISAIEIPLLEKIYRLIICKVDYDDLKFLIKWGDKRYKKWVLQSLWIKSLYFSEKKMEHADKEWLADFPPRMNREYFLVFVYMLYWCYLKSGLRTESELLVESLNREFGESLREHKVLSGINKLNRSILFKGNYFMNIRYWDMRLAYIIKTTLKNLILDFGDMRK